MHAVLKDYFCGIARRLLPYSLTCTIEEHKVARTSIACHQPGRMDTLCFSISEYQLQHLLPASIYLRIQRPTKMQQHMHRPHTINPDRPPVRYERSYYELRV